MGLTLDLRLAFDLLLVRSAVDGLDQHLRGGHGRRIQAGTGPKPRRPAGERNDQTTIAAIAAQVVARSHKDAIDRAGFDTQVQNIHFE